MAFRRQALLLFLLACLVGPVATFQVVRTPRTSRQRIYLPLEVMVEKIDRHEEKSAGQPPSRRKFLVPVASSLLAVVASVAVSVSAPEPVAALVKGNAPPTSSTKPGASKPKCTNVEECQALAEIKEQQEREAAEANRVPAKKTKTGVVYKDEQEGSGPEVKDGDDITLYYKVLKLGKRSYDGLSGEGTVVFSRGYGFEDDEKKPGDKSFSTTVGAFSNIAALNEAVVGMKLGGIRRISVIPAKGWRKATARCDGGPGGQGQGGDLKTDYVLVPTATMVEQEACFDQTRQPFPATYAQQRRMAQRFDQSLILEVEVSSIGSQ